MKQKSVDPSEANTPEGRDHDMAMQRSSMNAPAFGCISRCSTSRLRSSSFQESEYHMILPIVGKVTWAGLGVGAAVTAVGMVALRPLIVGTVRAGYEATDLAKDAWTKAKAEAESIKNEALTKKAAQDSEAEIAKLRQEVASLQAQVHAKRS